MKSYEDMPYNERAEELVEILCKRTQQKGNRLFFRVLVGYYFAVMASMMRAKVDSETDGVVPVNLFGLNLATSGFGKNRATNMMEHEVINQFFDTFIEDTFPKMAAVTLPKIATHKAARKQTDPDEELLKLEGRFDALGPMLLSFDSGTVPAIKQARQKLLMAESGSLNFQMDEVGANLVSSRDVFTAFLSLFDIGAIKEKLVKNTAENLRNEEIRGFTPANMMLFGTPSSLLDGGKTEDELYNMLEEGYARRCLFGYVKGDNNRHKMSAEDVYNERLSILSEGGLEAYSDYFNRLSDMAYMDRHIPVPKDVTLIFIEYQLNCEKLASAMGEHETLRKAELSHRYFKAMKLAGAYAFVDMSDHVNEQHAYEAIKLVEDSGKAFSKILNRDRNYVRLAKYIASVQRAVTQADLMEDCPFYRGTIQQKNEMLHLAIVYGYQNNILIKKDFTDGIEFIRGESLKTTNLNEMIISWSTDIAQGYKQELAPFDQLHEMTQQQGIHWATHGFANGHRAEEDALPGFNLVVLDIDHGLPIETALNLLSDYKLLLYTTKRHTDAEPRYRIVIPTNYELKLDAKDHKEFMANVYAALPFEVDTVTGQRSRKWLSHDGDYFYQEGGLLDVLPFIPKTSKNEEFKSKVLDQQGLDNLERWVMNNTGDGNRNNMLLRYAMILVDSGADFNAVLEKVKGLNSKLPDSLEEAEILTTVMQTVGKAISKKP